MKLFGAFMRDTDPALRTPKQKIGYLEPSKALGNVSVDAI